MLWILVHQRVLLKFYKNNNYDDKKLISAIIYYHLNFYKHQTQDGCNVLKFT